MQYSPKLKRVMEDIKSILVKEEIAGVVVLHILEGKPQLVKDTVKVEGFTEFLYHINTPYSAARIENGRFQVKGKAIHYPSKEERDKQLAGTVNMFEHLSMWTSKLALQCVDMSRMVNSMVEREEGNDGNFTSHDQQNN